MQMLNIYAYWKLTLSSLSGDLLCPVRLNFRDFANKSLFFNVVYCPTYCIILMHFFLKQFYFVTLY